MNNVTPMAERLAFLFDSGSFVELSPDAESSALIGYGLVDGRKTYLIADTLYSEVPSDFERLHAKKLALLGELAKDPGPLVLFADGFRKHPKKGNFIATPGFAEFLMGRNSVSAYMRELSKLSGVVPIVAALVGDSWAGGTLPPALCDTYVLIEGRRMSFGRPELYERMTGDKAGTAKVGNVEMHCSVSGVGDVLVRSEPEAIAWIKRYLSYFPSSFNGPSNVSARPVPPSQERIASLVIEPKRPFDMRDVVSCFVDEDSFLEVKEAYANEVLTGFARVNGSPVGIVGTNTVNKFGAVYPESCKKIAKFVTLCDSFNIPLFLLPDTPGLMVGKGLDEAGAIKLAALVASTLARATVPKALVIVRNSFGGGLLTIGPGYADSVVAFPEGKTGPFGAVAMRPPESPEEARAMRDMEDLGDMHRLLERGLIEKIVDKTTLRAHAIEFLERNRVSPRRAPAGVLCI